MKRMIPVIFALVAAVLALLFFSRNLFVKDKNHNYGLVSFAEHFGHKWMTGDVYKEE